MMRIPLTALLVVALVLPASVALPHGTDTDRLGKVNFPTSCTADAQGHFTRGVAMLHSFWLDTAIKEFTEAAQDDPTCGIAGWGVAMAWMGNHWPPRRPRHAGKARPQWKAKKIGSEPAGRDYVAAIELITGPRQDRPQDARRGLQEPWTAERPYRGREAAVYHALA
jgi:hypothetical protein